MESENIPFVACSIDGCERNAHRLANGATGLCCAHYKRKRKTGDPLGSLRKEGPALAWLREAASSNADECVIWPFSRNSQGYGFVRVNQKTFLAHRVVCEMAHGNAPGQLDAAHSCGKGHEGCVNPRHLRWDSRAGNCGDKLEHGTDNRGEKSPLAKLSRDDVVRIRELRGQMSQTAIAEIYGIDQSNVSKIQTGNSWSWL